MKYDKNWEVLVFKLGDPSPPERVRAAQNIANEITVDEVAIDELYGLLCDENELEIVKQRVAQTLITLSEKGNAAAQMLVKRDNVLAKLQRIIDPIPKKSVTVTWPGEKK